jgi:hypothetical protein
MAEQQVWRPHPRQTAFLSLPDTILEAMYGGAAGGGKSECLLMLPLARGFYKHPRFKGILFRRTYPELESEIIVRSHHFYTPAGGNYNSEKRRWTFPSGAVMQFGHVEYEQDVRKYDTAEYNYMGFDELTSFTQYQYIYLAMSRCRSSSRDLPAIVRSGTNPGNVGHGWVRDRFIEPAPAQSIILDSLTGLKRIFIPCLASDNPHIDPEYINRLGGLPEAERRAKRDGDWWTFSGQVFDDWREEHFPDEPENAQHVIQGFDIPPWWPRLLAIDWGFSAMTIALWGALSPDDRLYVYREMTFQKERISTWATEIGKASADEKLSDIVLCQSAFQDRGGDISIAAEFQKASGLLPRSSENSKGSRISGKLLLQEYLRWRPKPTRKTPRSNFSQDEAQEVLRKLGTVAHESYVKQFLEEKPECNLPRLQVFNTCKSIRKCIPLCIYDEKNKEDVKEFDGDDPYDCLRYLVKAANDRHFPANVDKYNKDIAEVLTEFSRNQNYTALHRSMERLESRKPKARPISRFHRRLR